MAVGMVQLQSFEHVLANINKLNRSLEAVIAVRRYLQPCWFMAWES
jgi:hypothetical protein